MIITKENIEKIREVFNLKDNDISLLNALLDDVDTFNRFPLILYPIAIGIQDWHIDCDEYPDHYGDYSIYIKCGEEKYEPISSELDLRGLDEGLCVLCSYFFDTGEILSDIKNDKE